MHPTTALARRLGAASRLACALLGVLGCAARSFGSAPAARPGPIVEASDRPNPGAIVVIGGRLEPDNAPVYRRILALRAGTGPICVLPTASGTPQESMQSFVQDFERYGGAGAGRGIAIEAGDLAAARDARLAESLRACGGFFFTGGDQSRIVDTLRPAGEPSPALRAILDRHRAGAPVAGTSAGAAVLSDPMIGGGESEPALMHGICGHDGCEGVWVRDGLGLLPGWITDQHFLERGRAGRLMAVLLDHVEGPRRGIGVDEDTAVVFHRDQAEVVGRSGAMMIDAREALRRADGGWSGIVLHMYGPGDVFRSIDGRLVEPLSAGPTDPSAGVGSTEAPATPFEGRSFAHLLMRLPEQDVQLQGSGWQLSVRRKPGFVASLARPPSDVAYVGPVEIDVVRSPR